MNRIEKIRKVLESSNERSAWNRGVNDYAMELLDNFEENYEPDEEVTEEKLLNGATSWMQYSWSGNSLCYSGDIAERLSTPSFLKAKKGGELPPTKDYAWLDWQAFALTQASYKLRKIAKNIK